MNEFDQLCEEYSSKSRKITRTERYPKGIALDRDFLERLEEEYFAQHSGGNRNFHSNFLKAISFELDKFKDNPELMSKHSVEEVADDMEIPAPDAVIVADVETPVV